MSAITTLGTCVAGIVGIITAVVSWRVLREAMGIRNPTLGACIGALSGIGLASSGGDMSALLIPFATLGVAILIMLLLGPLFKDAGKPGRKPHLRVEKPPRTDVPNDPWAEEIQRGGRLASRFKSGRPKSSAG